MSKRVWQLALLAAASVVLGTEAHSRASDISVEVIDEHGATFSQMPVRAQRKAYRAYLQAERGARYRIRVKNYSSERVGVVVAVDGRNIISGARSDLEHGEPMYILAAGDMQEYSGWRTSLAEVHEFYFTDWQDSYAEAFGDASARGVIAVAVYREKERRQPFRSGDAGPARERQSAQASAAPAPAAPEEPRSGASAGSAGADASSDRADKAERSAARDSEPGTGYGDRRDEPAVRVAFEAEPRASSRVFLKYEWRETLCRKGIIECGEPENRFWPDTLSFAPPPPAHMAARPGKLE
jgi:hypothetical protein